MNFPPVPEQEPLGPSRRIEGEYTLAKRMALAPVHVDCTEGLEETLVLGKDGGIYRGKKKYPSKLELDKKLRGTKRPIFKVVGTSSTRGYIEPSVVTLQTNDKPTLYGKGKKSLIELPTAEIRNVISMVKEKSIKGESETISDTTDQTETTELEKEDFQSEDDKVSEKSDETDTEKLPEAGKYSEESGKEGSTREDIGEASEEGGEEDNTEEGTEEVSKEEGEEDSTGEGTGETSEESDTEADESPESEKSLDTETADESDTKASEEEDIGESPEADELPDAGETE